METFILVYFWILLTRIVIRILMVAGEEYPRKVKYTLGSDVASLMIWIPFMFWAAYLLWS